MRERGGLVLPMYQAEALWTSFDAPGWRPMAVKVGAGMINAVDASPLDTEIRSERNDYLVSPPQLFAPAASIGWFPHRMGLT